MRPTIHTFVKFAALGCPFFVNRVSFARDWGKFLFGGDLFDYFDVVGCCCCFFWEGCCWGTGAEESKEEEEEECEAFRGGIDALEYIL